MNLSENFKLVDKLLAWKGSWASKSLFDDSVSRLINQQSQDDVLASRIFQNSYGYGAKVHFEKYTNLTGFDVSTDSLQLKLPKDVHSILDLSKVSSFYPTGLLSNLWIERLCDHLATSRKGLSEKITATLATDQPAAENDWSLINTFSRPFIERLLELPTSKSSIDYLEDEKAKLCWRRWHFKDGLKTPVLFETKNKTDLKQSQWFVWRLIHDAKYRSKIKLTKDGG